MDYLATIRKKERENLRHILEEARKGLCERVQGETSEISEKSPELDDGGEGYAVVMDSRMRKQQDERNEKSHTADVAMEPAAMNATPIFWERMSTGAILGPAQPEFLAMVGKGLKASYWIVAQFEGRPLWINSILLRSKRQFEAQWRPMRPTAPSIAQIPTVKPNPIMVEQSSLEFSDGRERTQTEAEGRRL